jgi:hypothetical protein
MDKQAQARLSPWLAEKTKYNQSTLLKTLKVLYLEPLETYGHK